MNAPAEGRTAPQSAGIAAITFVTANYVARVVGFSMTGGWGQGDRTTNEYFRPIETYRERFDELIGAITSAGFDAVDIWNPHLNWTWATEEHISVARAVLENHRVEAVSMAGGFGNTVEELERACALASAAGMPLLAGSTAALEVDRRRTVELLERYDVRLALENHPHIPTPDAVLAAIGDSARGRIGAAVDTGWFVTVGVDPVAALRQLQGHIMHVHLKDVRAAGDHETCRFGEGVVPVEKCVRELQRQGYRGPLAIEDEPETYDPTEDCVADLAMVRQWLSA
jgi:sugar phosphate isomerase/epimerase